METNIATVSGLTDNILIGVGGNLIGPGNAMPIAIAQSAERRLATLGIKVTRRSRWWLSEPQPRSEQPWYCNGVWRARSCLSPKRILDTLLTVERSLGRRRSRANAARVIDLDLLAVGDIIIQGAGDTALRLPHPRLAERAFVLEPIRDVAPDWHHPETGESVSALLASLGGAQSVMALPIRWRGR